MCEPVLPVSGLSLGGPPFFLRRVRIHPALGRRSVGSLGSGVFVLPECFYARPSCPTSHRRCGAELAALGHRHAARRTGREEVVHVGVDGMPVAAPHDMVGECGSQMTRYHSQYSIKYLSARRLISQGRVLFRPTGSGEAGRQPGRGNGEDTEEGCVLAALRRASALRRVNVSAPKVQKPGGPDHAEARERPPSRRTALQEGPGQL